MVKASINFFVLVVCFSLAANAQPSEIDVSSLKKNHQSDFYYLLYREIVTLEIKKQNIVSTTNTNKIFCYNNYKNTNYSSFDFPYNSAFSEIKNLKASSYVLEKGKYKEHEVKDFTTSAYSESDMFEDSYKEISFTMPAINNGTIGQIQYDEVNTEPHFSNFFYFKQFAPIQKSEYIIEVDNNIVIAYKFLGDTSGIVFEKSSKGNKTIYKWTAEDLPTIKREDYMPALNKVTTQIVCWIKYADINGEKKIINNDIHSFSSWIYNLAKKSYNSPLSPEAKQYVDSLKKMNLHDFELGKTIFEHVQKSIKYIAFEDGLHGYVPRKPADVYYKRYGDCKDKATLLSAMLNYAGIESKTALVGTSRILYKFSELPIPECANHMITAVKQKDIWVIADATDEYDSYLSIPEALQGKEALVLIDSLNYFICKIPVMPYYKNGRLDSLDVSLNNMEIKGNGKTFFFGYLKENMLEAINSLTEEKRMDFFKEILNVGNNKCNYTNIVHQQINDTTLLISYTISLPNYITQFENKYYLNPHLFKSGLDDYNIDSTRQYPVPFKYLSFTKHVLKVNKDSIEVNHMPVNASWAKDKFGFTITYENKEKYLLITSRYYENILELGKPDFQEYETYFTQLRKNYLDNIALLKK